MNTEPVRMSPRAAVGRRQEPRPSPIYDVLWRFAVKRQHVYMSRAAGLSVPWTDDPILARYRFTNPYRGADRVSQALISMVYSADDDVDDDTLFLRTMLFKVFNKTATWDGIVATLGMPDAKAYSVEEYDRVLTGMRASGPIYSAAYIMPSGGAGVPKHRMHLELIRRMLADRVPAKLRRSRNLEEVFTLLLAYPSLGPFLAFQYTIDLAYTPLVRHDEGQFVVAGPGALDGLSKCFDSLGDYSPAETIMWLTDRQNAEFARLGVAFEDLWGRALQPIDVQNLLCEVSKYTRVSHPTIAGVSGRTRIKQLFEQAGPIATPFFPPKWEINGMVAEWRARVPSGPPKSERPSIA
jgi:hypothetical protein